MRPRKHFTDEELVRLTDEELVRLCLALQDEALWREFVRRFQALIARTVRRRFARYTRIDPDRVDDLTQETFLKLCKDDYKALRTFEFWHENAFPGFLKVMALHVVEDDGRKRKRAKDGGGQEPENIDGLPQHPSDRSRSVASIFNSVRVSEIESCLQQRKDEPNFARDYRIFWLYFRDGFTANDISLLPDIELKNVKGVESVLLRLVKWVINCLNL